jgi:beta-lactam-binding protein with PASTA domain
MSKTKKALLITIPAVIILIAIAAIIFITKPSEAVPTAASHISLAENYLLDLNYEAAIAEYLAAIEIEPKNADYYIALAEIYVHMGDIPAAIEVLNEGLNAVDEPDKGKIRSVIDRIAPQEETAAKIYETAITTDTTTTTTDTFQDSLYGVEEIQEAFYNYKSDYEAFAIELEQNGIAVAKCEAVSDTVPSGELMLWNTANNVLAVYNYVNFIGSYTTDFWEDDNELKETNSIYVVVSIGSAISNQDRLIRIERFNPTHAYGTVLVEKVDGFYDPTNNSSYSIISAGPLNKVYDGVVITPDIYGLPYDEIKKQLESLGLCVLKQEITTDDPSEIGMVLGCSTTIIDDFSSYHYPDSSYIASLTVAAAITSENWESDANKPRVIKDVYGLKLDEAISFYEKQGFQVLIEEKYSETVESGFALQAKDWLDRVTIEVSVGKTPKPLQDQSIVCPKFTGLTQREARELAESTGLEYFNFSNYNSAYDDCIVIYQGFAPGSLISPSSGAGYDLSSSGFGEYPNFYSISPLNT